jgi:hypothetical protein
VAQPEINRILRTQAGAADLNSIDERAMATARISQQVALSVALNTGVLARDLGIRQREVATGATSKRERRTVNRDHPVDTIDIDDEPGVGFSSGIHGRERY